MKCPIDNTELSMTDRQGVEIDYCPKCRGVWLDRGELDKVIDRSATGAESSSQADITEQPRYKEEQSHRPARNNYYDERQYGKKRKKESFLSDLFDF